MNPVSLAIEAAIDTLSLGSHTICLTIFPSGLGTVRFAIETALDLISLAIQVPVNALSLRIGIILVPSPLPALGHCC
jgi:hypothetical protein